VLVCGDVDISLRYWGLSLLLGEVVEEHVLGRRLPVLVDADLLLSRWRGIRLLLALEPPLLTQELEPPARAELALQSEDWSPVHEDALQRH
jgi:hypothetical protein